MPSFEADHRSPEDLLREIPRESALRHIPRSQIKAVDFNQRLLGQGTRMAVAPMIDVCHALRIPLKSEDDLVKKSGAARVVDSDGRQISNITQMELERLKILKKYLGNHLPDMTPIGDLDLEGNYVYANIAERILITRGLVGWSFMTPRDAPDGLYEDLVQFTLGLMKLVEREGLIPDLIGAGNVVVGKLVLGEKEGGTLKTDTPNAYLLDVNNVQRVMNNREFFEVLLRNMGKDTQEKTVDEMAKTTGDLVMSRELDLTRLTRPFRRMNPQSNQMELLNKTVTLFPEGYLDDQDIPMGDLSLYSLKNLTEKLTPHNGFTPQELEFMGISEGVVRDAASIFHEKKRIFDPLRIEIRDRITRTMVYDDSC